MACTNTSSFVTSIQLIFISLRYVHISDTSNSFYCASYASTVLAVIVCLYVCLSVRLSEVGVVQR